MLPQVFALLVCFVLQAAARPSRPQTPFQTTTDEDDGCPTGVHIVGIRGTLEDAGFGAMQPLVDRLLKDIPGSESLAIDYPANGIEIGDDGKPNYKPLEYIRSVQQGRTQLSYDLGDMWAYCPNSSVVILSYSQVFLTTW